MIRATASAQRASAGEVLPLHSNVPASASTLSNIDPELWLKSWSQIDGKARMIVTRERILLWAEDNARRLIASEQMLRVRQRRVELLCASGTANFETFLESAESQPATFCSHVERAGGDLLMRGAKFTVVSGIALIGICFWVAGPQWKPDWIDMVRTFKLTAAEALVIGYLLRGVDAEAIAKEHKLSIDTVRTHIRHAYAKLGISKREGLWKRLAPYRLN